MNSPHVYDKAKYHQETIQTHGLPDHYAYTHTVVFLRWLIERRMMSDFFEQEGADIVAKFRSGNADIAAVYEWWDCCLIEDMLSSDGNAFALHYFDFEKGQYLQDYIGALQSDLPSEFHIEPTEENYQKMKAIVDRRFGEWRSPKRRWWLFGK